MEICDAIQLINVDVSVEAYGIIINFKRSTREDLLFVKSITKLYYPLNFLLFSVRIQYIKDIIYKDIIYL